MKCKLQSRSNCFSVSFYVLSIVIGQQFPKNWQFQLILLVVCNCLVKYSNQYVKVHRKIVRTWFCIKFYLNIYKLIFLKVMPHSKRIKTSKYCCSLCNFIQTNIFWNFEHTSRNYNSINYRSVWFTQVNIILIITTHVFVSDVIFEKDPRFNPLNASVAII